MADPDATRVPSPWDRTLDTPEFHQYLDHLPLKQLCGICNGTIVKGDMCVGLIGNDTATSLWKRTEPFVVPEPFERVSSIHRWLICARRRCPQCDKKPNTATVHLECLEMFRRAYTSRSAPDRLFRHAAWRQPSARMPCLGLPETTHIHLSVVSVVAEKYGLPGLTKLPQEILQIIRNYSASAHFWRYVSGLDLAARLAETSEPDPDEECFVVPLREVVRWERGTSRPEVSKKPLPVIRLTIDSRGIRRFESLAEEQARYRHERYDDRLFVVQDTSDAQLEGITALFQDGLMRLHIPQWQSNLHLWDLPTPPTFPASIPEGDESAPRVVQLLQEPQEKDSRSYSIDLTVVSGLTFFFANYLGMVYIHGHTRDWPYASIPSGLSPNGMCWLYVPISKNDRILSLDLRSRDSEFPMKWPSILLRTELTGQNIFGTFLRSEFPIYSLGTIPTMLFFTRSSLLGHITRIGTVSRARAAPPRPPYRLPTAEDIVPNFLAMDHLVKFSSAPLNGIKTATVFHPDSQPDSSCLGILFDYENGGRRAVGQCRLGVDYVRVYERPTHVCVKNMLHLPDGEPELQWTVKAQFSKGEDHVHEGEGRDMHCFELRDNILDFWFTAREFCIEIRRQDQAPGSSAWNSHAYAISTS